MKIKINVFTVKTDNITAITEDAENVIIEYFNGSIYMELDKELVTLEEVKTALNM